MNTKRASDGVLLVQRRFRVEHGERLGRAEHSMY
jgi:hypothetical protein